MSEQAIKQPEMNAILEDYKNFCKKADEFIDNFVEHYKKSIGEEEWKKTQLSLTK